jgi:hypothetical protein
MRIILGCLFVLALMTPAPALSQAVAARYQVPAVRKDGWKTANADSVGVDSTKLANLTTAIRAWPELPKWVSVSTVTR